MYIEPISLSNIKDAVKTSDMYSFWCRKDIPFLLWLNMACFSNLSRN